MGTSATSELVRRVLARTRWLHGILILLVLFLAAGSLRNGGRRDEWKRELEKFRHLQLIEEARVTRIGGKKDWFAEARALLDQARRIKADNKLREAWLECLLLYPSHEADQPVPYRTLPFPPGLSLAPISFAFSPDQRAVTAFADGRRIDWTLDDLHRLPRVLPGPNQPPEPVTTSRSGDSQLVASLSETGRLEIRDSVTGRFVIPLRGPNSLRIEALAWSSDGEWIISAGWVVPSAGPNQRVIELWYIPALRSGLALLDLDWSDSDPSAAPVTPVDPNRWVQPVKVAIGGFLVVAVTAAVITYQHRVFQRYLQAERAAAERAEELEQARERVAHAEKMRALGTLAAGVAHDFNNLLSVIQMSRQLIERAGSVAPPVREHLENIAQAVDQGRTVVRSILGYSRETSQVSRHLRIADVVDETLTLLRRQFLGGLEVSIELDPSLPLLDANPGRLEQILLNLLVNASEAMAGRGSLRILGDVVSAQMDWVLAPTRPGPWLRLVVADSGPGIAPDVLPRIFEPFFTSKNLGNQRGTGMGLATVWRIASEEGLGVGVHSRPGLGSEFHLYISTQPTPANPEPGTK
jgi:signal transduction histidine kinase